MIIATWNVNSIRVRMPRLLELLEKKKPDVLCLQETKVVDAEFPLQEIEALGYRCLINGQKTYNGVAILSRAAATDPIFCLPNDAPEAPRRLLAATVEGVRIINVYAPNGSDVGTDKYAFKLQWYERLRSFLDAAFDPKGDVLLCGDFNIAPEDRDVWDPERWRGQILFSDPEKAALGEIVKWGLTDALRLHHQESGIYTWWDYRQGAFHRGWGLRIDHILVTPSLASRSLDVLVDRDERKGEKPSDHAPVMAIFR